MPARTRSTIKLRPSSAAASDFRKDRQGARARFARVVDREDEKPVPSCKWVQRRRCGSRGGSRSSRFHKRLLRRGYCGGRSARDFRRDGLRLGERNVLMCAVMGFRRIKERTRLNASLQYWTCLNCDTGGVSSGVVVIRTIGHRGFRHQDVRLFAGEHPIQIVR